VAAIVTSDDPEPEPTLVAGICTITGHPERAGKLYINASLTGRSGSKTRERVAAAAVFIRDPGVWTSFKRVTRSGNHWSIPAALSWEVGEPPYEGPKEPFSFQAFANVGDIHIPPDSKEFRSIPKGLARVGDDITRTRRQLGSQNTYRNPDCVG
jgi:hypothetical protein